MFCLSLSGHFTQVVLTVKPVLKAASQKIDKTEVLKTGGILLPRPLSNDPQFIQYIYSHTQSVTPQSILWKYSLMQIESIAECILQ